MWPVARLSEISTINLHDGGLSKKHYRNGNIPVVGNGMSPRATHNIANTPENTIIISRTGSYGRVSMYKQPVFLTNEAYFLSNIMSTITSNFLYFYLKYIAAETFRKKSRSSNSNLSITKVASTKICTPPLDIQARFVTAYSTYENTGSTSAFDSELNQIISEMQLAVKHSISVNGKKRSSRSIIWLTRILLVIIVSLAVGCMISAHHEKLMDFYHWGRTFIKKHSSSLIDSMPYHSDFCQPISFEI